MAGLLGPCPLGCFWERCCLFLGSDPTCATQDLSPKLLFSHSQHLGDRHLPPLQPATIPKLNISIRTKGSVEVSGDQGGWKDGHWIFHIVPWPTAVTGAGNLVQGTWGKVGGWGGDMVLKGTTGMQSSLVGGSLRPMSPLRTRSNGRPILQLSCVGPTLLSYQGPHLPPSFLLLHPSTT